MRQMASIHLVRRIRYEDSYEVKNGNVHGDAWPRAGKSAS
jgi:hypothetical protein